MRKLNSLRQHFGLTQIEMAMLLKVTRTQWSLYECGKRRLPPEAIKLLTEIAAKFNFDDSDSADNALQKIVADNEIQTHIKRRLSETEFQIQKTALELASLEPKLIKQARFRKLTDTLNRPQAKEKSERFSNAKGRLLKQTAKQSKLSVTAFELSHKLELLKFEKQLLESKLVGLADSAKS